MAVLPTIARVSVWQALMHDLSVALEDSGLTKAQLRAAVDAADDWVDANAAAYNAALPAAARTTLTGAQKARILAAVVSKRFTG